VLLNGKEYGRMWKTHAYETVRHGCPRITWRVKPCGEEPDKGRSMRSVQAFLCTICEHKKAENITETTYGI
jgi:hypothetical protein